MTDIAVPLEVLEAHLKTYNPISRKLHGCQTFMILHKLSFKLSHVILAITLGELDRSQPYAHSKRVEKLEQTGRLVDGSQVLLLFIASLYIYIWTRTRLTLAYS